MRFLGVDFGTKHTGLALGENGNTMPLDSITTTNINTLIESIKNIVYSEKIDLIVVGLPKHTNPKQENLTQKFIDILKLEVDTEVTTIDETSSSKEVFKSHFTKYSGLKKLNKKIHKLSAEKILERYFDKQQ